MQLNRFIRTTIQIKILYASPLFPGPKKRKMAVGQGKIHLAGKEKFTWPEIDGWRQRDLNLLLYLFCVSYLHRGLSIIALVWTSLCPLICLCEHVSNMYHMIRQCISMSLGQSHSKPPATDAAANNWSLSFFYRVEFREIHRRVRKRNTTQFIACSN